MIRPDEIVSPKISRILLPVVVGSFRVLYVKYSSTNQQSTRMMPLRRLIHFFLLYINASRGFPNQAGSCAGIGGSSHDRKDALTLLPNVTMRVNRHVALIQNKEIVVVVVVADAGTDNESSPSGGVVLELLSDDGATFFKGALIRVEQVYPTSNSAPTTTTTTTQQQSFELRPQSHNAQSSNLCWNPLVQAVTHKNPAPKQSMLAVLSVTDMEALPIVFAIDVTIVFANNATASVYGLQTFRLRLDPQPTVAALAIERLDDSSPKVVVVEPAADDDHRIYPGLNSTDTTTSTAACPLCSDSREKLRYPNDSVRWGNGTDVTCAALSSMISSSPNQCRIVQELVRDDGACGGCRPRTDCELPCIINPSGTLPILGQTIDCHLLTESLDVLLTVRTCAVSQALVRAHCGCRTDNDGLETLSSNGGQVSSSAQYDAPNLPFWWALLLLLLQ
jgi:hypothetical protein